MSSSMAPAKSVSFFISIRHDLQHRNFCSAPLTTSPTSEPFTIVLEGNVDNQGNQTGYSGLFYVMLILGIIGVIGFLIVASGAAAGGM